jgi:all-trans-retinol dehydrogenase (NAD+)
LNTNAIRMNLAWQGGTGNSHLMKAHGKTIFITGTARGIGQALAVAYAKAGCHVIGCDLTEQTETAAMVGENYTQLIGDIATPEGAKALVDQAIDIGFDVLINNAGIATSGTFADADFARWKRTIDVNLIGLMAVTHAALPHLRSQPEAHIVNLSSIAGAWGSPGMAAYCASKHGVTGFTRSLEYELANTKIGVSSIHPSMARTRMIDDVPNTKLTPVIEPDDVVKAVMRAIELNKPQIFVPGRMRWMINIVPRLFPSLTKRLLLSDKNAQGWTNANKDVPEI